MHTKCIFLWDRVLLSSVRLPPKREDGSNDVKRLPPPMDRNTRGVTANIIRVSLKLWRSCIKTANNIVWYGITCQIMLSVIFRVN